MKCLLLLFTLASARGNGFFSDLYRSHVSSSTAGHDFNYRQKEDEIYTSPKPATGAFIGMPPPPDSPYMGSIATHYPVTLAREEPISLPLREDPWKSVTTELYKTDSLTSLYQTKNVNADWNDQRKLRDTSERNTVSKGSKEEEEWATLSIFGKDSQTKKKLAETWCNNYNTKCRSTRSTATETNGIFVRITGGHPAKPKEHPHMVMIGYGDRNRKQWLCGGTLVSSRFILSAAHCAVSAMVSPARWVRLGELDISSSREDARPQEREIVERFVHPEYKETSAYHDIALFKMDREVVFNAWISPVCLHTGESEPRRRATITGWGRTNFVSETSPVLMEADVTIFNSTYCKQTVNRIAGPKMPRGYDSLSMICAGEDNGGKDACQGDSGGPLIVESNGCTKLQVGITSVGRDCGLPQSPGVYTRVSNYIPWLESIIWR